MVVLTIVTKKNGETFFFDEPLPKAHFMKLVSCSLYNSWNNLSTWGTVRTVNNSKNFDLLSVPSGHHTLETLVGYFNQDKNKAVSAAYTINGGIYFLSKSYEVEFIEGLVGLFSSSTTKDNKTWNFGGLKINSYFIHCNIIDKEENYFNTNKTDLLAKFDVKGMPYEKRFYQAGNEDLFRKCSTDQFFKSITISVKDEYGNLFDFNGMPLEFVLEIK